MVKTSARVPTWVLFMGAGLVWGASFLFIKVGLTGMNPAQLAVTRLGFGVAALGVIMLITRTKPITHLRSLGHIAVVGFFLAGLPLMIWAWAGQYLPSGELAIFNAATPLLTLLLTSVFLPSDRMRASGVLGVLLGAVGLVVVVAPWRGSESASASGSAMTVVAYLACLSATLCYAIGYVYLRKMLRAGDFNPIALAFAQISAGFVAVLLLSIPAGLAEPMHLNLAAVLAVAVLGSFGTGIAYIWNNQIVADWGSVRASMVTYCTPVVGVLLGATLLGESLSWNEPIGMVVLFVGIALAQGVLRLPQRTLRPA